MTLMLTRLPCGGSQTNVPALTSHFTRGTPCRVEPPRPRRIPGATWQAGVTAGNATFKVLLNGEPLNQCFAACAGDDGWAMVRPDPELQKVKPTTRAPLGLAYLIDEFGADVMKTGKVEIVPVAGGRPRQTKP